MRLLFKLSLSLFLMMWMTSLTLAQSDTLRPDGVYYKKLRNGMNAVMMPLPSAAATEITFQIRCGSIYETDSVTGIANLLQHLLAYRMADALKNSQNPAFQNTTLQSYTTPEHSIFKFTTSSDQIAACLMLVKQHFYNAVITEADLKETKDSVLMEVRLAEQNPSVVFEDSILKRVYRNDYEKMKPAGNPDKFESITAEYANKFYEKYYVPNNTIVLGTGNFNVLAFDMHFTRVYDSISRSIYDPEEITTIVDIRPMIHSSQFIVEDSAATPEFQICWQFPGTNSNNKASYSAHLLATMINDYDNFIQVKAAKMGCKKLFAQYEANNFTSILRVVVRPDTANFFSTYQFIVKELMRLERTLVNESMMNAGKIQFRKNYEILKARKEFAEQIVHHTAYKDNKYYVLLIDSVMTITERTMNTFVLNYMSQIPHVTGLKISKELRASLKLDSVFNAIDQGVADYVFRYRQNVTELEGDTNLTMQNNLLQWMQINSDVFVQVNGYSDESEYDKVRDKDVIQFVDSIPTFRKRVADLIQRGYFSPAMMRAMRIIKFLYENGIAAERLSGTGMQFTSDTDAEEIENMKCTLTFDKLRKNKTTRELYNRKK